MQDTKIGRCYHGEEGTYLPCSVVPQGFSLSERVGGKALFSKVSGALFYFLKAYVLTWASAWLLVGLPYGACNPQAGSVTLLTVKLFCKS